jgi:hypothetical protein
MVLINAKAHYKQVKVIRSDIGTEPAEKCRDAQNEPISRKEPLGPICKTPLHFFSGG